MNKITKMFLVIISVASFSLSSAIAGELTVTGGVTATVLTKSGYSNAGRGLGVSNELDFTANGELDNGMAWKWQTQLDDAGTVNDDTRLELTTPYGLVGMYISENDISTKLGYGIGAMGVGSDYAGPATLEWGTTMNSYNNVGVQTPAGLLPAGAVVSFAHAPNLSSTQGASAKAAGAVEVASVGDAAYSVRVKASPIDGLSVGADYMTVEGGFARYEEESGGAFLKYTQGPFTVGAARSLFQDGIATGGAVGTASFHYETDMYGIQFAVNDALSLSYSEEKSTKVNSQTMSVAAVKADVANIETTVKHVQAAYVIGGATLGLAIADGDDINYTANRDGKTTTLSIAMDF